MKHSGASSLERKHIPAATRAPTCGDIKDAGRNARTNERNSSPETKVNDSLARSLIRARARVLQLAVRYFRDN